MGTDLCINYNSLESLVSTRFWNLNYDRLLISRITPIGGGKSLSLS